jgi:hypothetical protein
MFFKYVALYLYDYTMSQARGPQLSRYSNGLWAGRLGFDRRQGQGFSFLHSVTDWLWGQPGLLSNVYQELFPRGWIGRVVKLTTHSSLVRRSRIVELYLHSRRVFMVFFYQLYLFLNIFVLFSADPVELFHEVCLFIVSLTTLSVAQNV